MKRHLLVLALVAGAQAFGGQPPFGAAAPNIPISDRDRVYFAEQFSNTVSVVNPATNELVGVLRLGDPQPQNLSPLYKGQVLVHGLGFSPDRRTLVVVAIASNAVNFIDTATNTVQHVTYVGRSPHEAFFTQDGGEVWVTIRGEDYVSVLDAKTHRERMRIQVPNGPGMTIFSPDGRYGYVSSSFTPETVVVAVATHRIVGRVKQDSPFCPNLAVTPEGDQVWLTLKDTGRIMVFDGSPPFRVLRSIDSGPITNHVNFISTARGRFAYVTVGGLNQVQVYKVGDDFARVATIPVGDLPHGIWPSGDGTRVYVGLENGAEALAIDTTRNEVVGRVGIGQAAQAVVYIPGAVPSGDGRANLVPLGVAGSTTHLSLGTAGRQLSSVALFDQGLTQVLQVAAAGLQPARQYGLALTAHPSQPTDIELLARFTTNPSGSAIVNAVGPVRQIAKGDADAKPRFLFIAPVEGETVGAPVQVQLKAGEK
jgi:DNA-binding beta-propeller fold protein YncE